MTSITTVYKWLYPYLELYVCIWKKNNFKHVYKHISSWFESWNRKNKIKCVYKHLSLMVENLSTDYRDVSRLELNVCTLEKGKNNLKHMHEKLYTGFELNVGTKKKSVLAFWVEAFYWYTVAQKTGLMFAYYNADIMENLIKSHKNIVILVHRCCNIPLHQKVE